MPVKAFKSILKSKTLNFSMDVLITALLFVAIISTISFTILTSFAEQEFKEAVDNNMRPNLDLAVVNYRDNDIYILLGNGDGTFGNSTDFDVGNNPITIAVGDLNTD
jgi:hypothetical protein